MNYGDRRPRANGGNKKEGETHVMTVVPTWLNFPLVQEYQYSANINPSQPTTLPVKNAQSSTKAIPKLATKSAQCTSKTKHHP